MRNLLQKIKNTTRSKEFRIQFVIFVFFGVLVNFFFYYFTKKENRVYYWDLISFWTKYLSIGEGLRINIPNTLRYVKEGIQRNDYNSFATLFTVPFFYLFGGGRAAFMAGLVNALAIPSVLLLSLFSKKLLGLGFRKVTLDISILIIFAISILPQFWSATLYGYVGIMGVGVISSIYLLYLNIQKKNSPGNLYKYFAIGILSALLVVIRRWFLYWTITFYFLIFLFALKEYFLDKKSKKNLISLRNIVFSGIISAATFLSLSLPLVIRILNTNYSYVYKAYATGRIFTLLSLFNNFGLFTILLFVSGVVVSLFNKKISKFAYLLIFQLVLIYILFSSVQNFEVNHYYLLLPTLLVFETYFLYFVKQKLMHIKLAWPLFAMLFIFLSIVNFSKVYFPEMYGILNIGIFSKETHFPLVRKDMPEVRRLMETLEGTKGTVYVVSSSDVLNSEIVQRSDLFLKKQNSLRNRVLVASDIDRRDGFPESFFRADYIVVAYPLQYHRDPQYQKIIKVLADFTTNGVDTGYYSKLPYEFNLKRGVKVYIYKRNVEIPYNVIRKVSSYFYKIIE
jgi:hypothetical protein